MSAMEKQINRPNQRGLCTEAFARPYMSMRQVPSDPSPSPSKIVDAELTDQSVRFTKLCFLVNTRVPAENAMSLHVYDAYTHHTRSSKSFVFVFSEIARENMFQGAPNSCICSNCFVRSYDVYNLENRSVVGKKRGSVKPFKPRTAEEVERTF